jgi:hypothetical protein
MGNLDLEESSGTPSGSGIGNISEKDFITRYGNVSQNAKNKGSCKQTESYQDWSQGASSLHQVYVIISDTSEEVDNENNPVINPHNLERGANYRAEGETTPREKLHLSAEEWQMFKVAMHHGAAIPADSRREVLMGYQYALHQQKKPLLREKSKIRRMHESAIEASGILREECSNTSYTGGGQRHEASKGEADQQNKDEHDVLFLSADKIGNIMPKTPEAALVAAHTYLLTIQPALGDPREGMHQAAIKGLGLVGNKLQQDNTQPEKRSRNSQSPQPSRSRSPAGENHRRNDARNIITQARINKSCYEWDNGNYEDEEIEMGAPCFTRRVRRTKVPKGFKLPHDQ